MKKITQKYFNSTIHLTRAEPGRFNGNLRGLCGHIPQNLPSVIYTTSNLLTFSDILRSDNIKEMDSSVFAIQMTVILFITAQQPICSNALCILTINNA